MKSSFKKERIKRFWSHFTGNSNKSKALRVSAIITALMVVSLFGYCFMSTNEAYYSRTIAKISSVTQTKDSLAYDMNGKSEQVYKQDIKAVVMNGTHKGEKILLQNRTSYSIELFHNRYV